MSDAQRFTTPVGRFVSGSAYEQQKVIDPITKQPKLDDAGQQRYEYFIGVAIPKDGMNHWALSDWGKVIWEAAFAGFPGQQQLIMLPDGTLNEDFAWKIIDGDSQKPNKAGKIPAQNENYRGCWVIQCKTSFIPQFWNADGSQAIAGTEIKRGYYVQVSGTVRANGIPTNAGVYLNHDMIALAGYGEILHGGADVSEAHFGGAALPPGASATPVNQFDTTQVAAPAQAPQMQVPQQQAPAQQPAPVAQPAQVPQQQAPAQQTAPQQVPAAVPGQTAPQMTPPGAPHQQILNPPATPQ